MAEKRKAITLEEKYKILKLKESGKKINEIATECKLSHSTVSTIVKNKDKYLKEVKSATPMLSKKIRVRESLKKKEGRGRKSFIPEVEKVLIEWINYQTLQVRMPLNQTTISAKALSIFETLKQRHGETDERFHASNGWFDRFRKRAGLHNLKVLGEAASADASTAEIYPSKLTKIIDDGKYSARLIFNADETGLFWKRMPSRTYIAKEEKNMPGYKSAKERVTVLLSANVAGDFKLKPLVIHRSENPRALKRVNKSSLPVIWKSTAKAWMTALVFEDWIENHFIPEVQRYCYDNNLTFNVLLLVDNVSSHPATLQHKYNNLQILFLPPNTSSILQPMDQTVLASFKAYYLRETFKSLIAAVDKEGGPTIREFWKKFNILDAVKIIAKSWLEVNEKTLKHSWKKLCPQFFEDVGHVINPVQEVTEVVVEIAKRLNLEVSCDDVSEIIHVDGNELSNEDLIEMATQELTEETEDVDTLEATEQKLTIKGLSDAFEMIESGLKIFEVEDPEFQRSAKVCEAVRREISCYKEILREKIKTSVVQKPIEYFFTSTNANESEPSTSKNINNK